MSIQQPYPRQPRAGVPEPTGRRRVLRMVLVVAGVLAGAAVSVAAAFGLLWAVNPMGDEWQCSDGEAPAGVPGRYNQCFEEDEPLPAGYEWDPWGNRPLSHNCDKRGWMLVERTVPGRRGSEVEQDCVREGTDLPGRWRPADD